MTASNMEHGQAAKLMHDLLRALVAKKGSDLFVSASFPPAIKVDGRMTPISEQPLTPQYTLALARAIMNDRQASEFERTKECNFAIAPGTIGRFRVNCYVQRGTTAMVLRVIPDKIPTLDELQLPARLKEVALEKRGLVIFAGATGSGKSTSLAAMIDWRNEHTHGHIVTIEDPIEFVHPNKSCLVSQREVGVDTESWEAALKNTLRQAPDLILIGEIRDRATMEHAIAFAETGHLAMGTLHANNANQALDRIINFFPEERRAQLLTDLSLNLKAVVSQRLVPCENTKGRVAAVELMLNSPYVSELIQKGDVHEIKEQMKKARNQGMQVFDQSLFDLYEAGMISAEDAARYADSPHEVKLAIRLQSTRFQKTGTPDARGIPAIEPVKR